MNRDLLKESFVRHLAKVEASYFTAGNLGRRHLCRLCCEGPFDWRRKERGHTQRPPRRNRRARGVAGAPVSAGRELLTQDGNMCLPALRLLSHPKLLCLLLLVLQLFTISLCLIVSELFSHLFCLAGYSVKRFALLAGQRVGCRSCPPASYSAWTLL